MNAAQLDAALRGYDTNRAASNLKDDAAVRSMLKKQIPPGVTDDQIILGNNLSLAEEIAFNFMHDGSGNGI